MGFDSPVNRIESSETVGVGGGVATGSRVSVEGAGLVPVGEGVFGGRESDRDPHAAAIKATPTIIGHARFIALDGACSR